MPLIVGFPAFATKLAPAAADLNAALGKILEKLGGVLGTTRYPGALARDNFAGGLKAPAAAFVESRSITALAVRAIGAPYVTAEDRLAVARDLRAFALTGAFDTAGAPPASLSLVIGDRRETLVYPDPAGRSATRTGYPPTGAHPTYTHFSFPLDLQIPANSGVFIEKNAVVVGAVLWCVAGHVP